MAAKRLKLSSTAADDAAINAAASLLLSGGVPVVPMETVYGALARIDHARAMGRLRALRSSPAGKPLALHVGSATAAEQYIDAPSGYLRNLMAKLWPGPVGIVFNVSDARRQEVAERLALELKDLYEAGQITIRCPAHRVARDVIDRCPHPVAGVPAADDALTAASLPSRVLDQVDLVLDDGPVKHGKPSTIIRVTEQDFEIIRAGVYDRRIIEKMLQTTILFVCSGNTCRSPMAQAVARKVLSDSLKIPEKELERAGFQVLSAGTSALPGSPATDHAAEAVKELGADLSTHRSRPLTQQLVSQATVIFAMGRSHADTVRLIDPTAASKTVLLDAQGDIEDPIGGELALYKNLATKIKGIIERRLADRSLLGMEK